ncbi:VOC family protein [Frankia sp. CNm7]|uniref:VOC family protein n=1 Tax=Frankia nepalensis TaxID=1836974 RepID=A0A937RJH4_9ACTN|nr:VOC family protein [Frankia nepalensis]MBL7501955.1 VOC family protein [Frankia nepalensis]MBL7510585.1 VOC family protein [Frankia nepalensis]MBL7517325.1 VOC family protein [Frankia nepalensis]MBL7633408.1 VOC family protein [Frankia nepalensis]
MSRIRPKAFVHIVYRTHRFDTMMDWYQKVFGARVQFRNEMLGFLTYDEEHHRFALVNLDLLDPNPKEKHRIGLVGVDHVAYTFASLRELLENWEHLKAMGVEPYWCIHHGITVSLYYGDPDGNQMEFQIESFSTPEEASAFMTGPGYTENPIGVEFDPESWLARVRAGTPESDFLIREVHQPVSPIRFSTPN